MTQALAFNGVTSRFSSYTVLDDLTFAIDERRFVSIVGPSGCGKSTLLNLVAGLLTPSAGRIDSFGRPLAGLNRDASYVFQQDALLPWKTVLDNIQLGLILRRQPSADVQMCAKKWLERVGLQGFGDHYPYQLSGGMRKRAALAQSWIVEPKLILMDEPFSALDVHTRLRMESELLALWTGSQQTVMFVTHDLEEAISLSDEVFVLSAGPASRLVGRYPVELARPRNLIDIKSDARFHELYRLIWSDLRPEVLKSHARMA
jgi:NitT/TauT family transport system ATP-binding protein